MSIPEKLVSEDKTTKGPGEAWCVSIRRWRLAIRPNHAIAGQTSSHRDTAARCYKRRTVIQTMESGSDGRLS